MERVRGAATPYEVYCHRCRVTFPVEARRCIHCGGPLTGQAAAVASPTLRTGAVFPPAAAPSPEEARGPLPPEDEEGGEFEGSSLLLRRFGGLALWALIALAAMISNLCSGRE
jgi:hypothetical protein